MAILRFMLALMGAMLTLAPITSAQSVRIMPLGDSITGSPGCWRALLWQRLQRAGITNTDFVGTLPGQGCGFSYDGENEGHGGFLATGIVSQRQLPGWLASTRPDVVMMHLGTNDVWSSKSPAEILAAFGTMVDWMRENQGGMGILVAQIIPMRPPDCPQCFDRVVALNQAIPAWAASKSTSESPIIVVDCWTGFDPSRDTGDGVHPNNSGNEKLANCWYDPLVRVIRG